jgi:preprotein translocase subunit YajC
VQVILHAGIKGKVLSVSEDELEIESGKGTKLRVLRGAVGKVLPAEEK